MLRTPLLHCWPCGSNLSASLFTDNLLILLLVLPPRIYAPQSRSLLVEELMDFATPPLIGGSPMLFGYEVANTQIYPCYPAFIPFYYIHFLFIHDLNNIIPSFILVLSFKPAIFGKISWSPSTLICWFVKIHHIEKRFPVSICYHQDLLSGLSWKIYYLQNFLY